MVSEYFFTPSTQSSMRARVPVMVAAACTATGDPTVDPLAGLHTCTPADKGAEQVELVPTEKLKSERCRRLSTSAV